MTSPNQVSVGPGGWFDELTSVVKRASVSAGERPFSASMPFDCMLAKLNPDMTKLPTNCGGVILAVAAICASTSRTLQLVHNDGAAHCGSVSAWRSAANALRSAWMMPQTSVLTTGCPSPQCRLPRQAWLDECTRRGSLLGTNILTRCQPCPSSPAPHARQKFTARDLAADDEALP